MFQHDNNDYKFKKIIDEFILSSSDNESIKYILRNIDFEAFKLGISFYQMIFQYRSPPRTNSKKTKWPIIIIYYIFNLIETGS